MTSDSDSSLLLPKKLINKKVFRNGLWLKLIQISCISVALIGERMESFFDQIFLIKRSELIFSDIEFICIGINTLIILMSNFFFWGGELRGICFCLICFCSRHFFSNRPFSSLIFFCSFISMYFFSLHINLCRFLFIWLPEDAHIIFSCSSL